jgi:hypothetical protein
MVSQDFTSRALATKSNKAGCACRAAGLVMTLPVGRRRLCLRQKTFALGALAGQFARTTDGFGLPARLGLGRLLESSAGLHFPEDALALHLLLERLQRLIDVVIADNDLNYLKLSIGSRTGAGVISRMLQRRNGHKRSL